VRRNVHTSACLSGFGWANADFPGFYPWSNTNHSHDLSNRRQKTSKQKIQKVTECGLKDSDVSCQDSANVTLESRCEFSALAPSFDKLLSCLIMLCIISFLRFLLVRVIKLYSPETETPTSLKFPSWEGPVFLVIALLSGFLVVCVFISL